MLVVADGVGGWNNQGVDPALYSKELCKNIKESFKNYFCNNKNVSLSSKVAKDMLINSAMLTKSLGSSTCCLLLLDKENKKLYSSYIGDSLYMIIRYIDHKFQMIYLSPEQVHSFNYPYQIGKNSDNPNEAIINTHDIKDKDVIIVASDG